MIQKIYNLFSTPVFSSKIEILDNESFFIENLKFEKTEINNGNISVNKYVLNFKKLQKLKIKILNEINVFTRNYLKVKKNINFYITNSWVMEHELNNYAQTHLHSNSIISGVLYIKTPDQSGNICFNSNRINSSFFGSTINLEYDDYNILNCDKWTINVEKGLLLLFPSNALHSTEKCVSNEKRYCLAFNVFIKGKLGTKEDRIILK